MSALSLVSHESTRDHRAVSTSDRERHISRLGDAIATLAARLHAATYELLVMLREFDACAGWNNGWLSCAHWLHWRTGIDLGAAREKVRVARVLATLPRISAAMQRGALSYAKVRALTHIATPDNEARLGSSVSPSPARPPTSNAWFAHGGERTASRPRRQCHGPVLLPLLNLELDDGAIVFYRPDGTRVEMAPAMPRCENGHGGLLRPASTRLAMAGGVVAPSATTPCAEHQSFDVGWALDVLRPGTAASATMQGPPLETEA